MTTPSTDSQLDDAALDGLTPAPGLPRAHRPSRRPAIAPEPAPGDLAAPDPIPAPPTARRRRRAEDRLPRARAGGIVLEVRDTPTAQASLVAAARLAATEDVVLHLVVTHVLQDSSPHRLERVGAPVDIAHAITPRGDADILLAEAMRSVAALGVLARGHTLHATRSGALRAVARRVGAAIVLTDGEPPRRIAMRMPCPVQRADLAARPLFDAVAAAGDVPGRGRPDVPEPVAPPARGLLDWLLGRS